jgi:hypothetical protein
MTAEENLRREVFALAYHLKWAPGEILALPVTERRAYLRLLVEQLEHEEKSVKEAGAQR